MFTLAALVAVLLQTLVIQTHVDGLSGLQASAAVESAAGATVPVHYVGDKSGEQGVCPICEALATAGVTLLASAAGLLTTAGIVANEALIQIRVVPVRPAHPWQSRAPPISL